VSARRRTAEAAPPPRPAVAGCVRGGLRSPAARRGGALLFGAAVLAVPFVTSGYTLREATTIVMYMALALAWNLVSGLCGYPSLGNTAFFGVGAYLTAALVQNLRWPFPLALLLTAVLAMAFAVVVGLPVLRLHGHYFAIATLGVAEALGQIVILIPWVGGPNGIVLTGAAGSSGRDVYYWMAGVLGLAMLVTHLVLRGSWGYACRMIRQDEVAAASVGENTTLYKTACWALAGVVGSLAGGVYALWITFVNPASVFDRSISLTSIVLALVGGAGTLWGPVVGALLVELIDQYLWSHFLTAHYLFLGVVVVFIVLFLPRGLWPYLSGEEAAGWRSIFRGMEQFRV
jgi:branched-chain amino acid transport system permease protein